jgi:hypothetical protein
MFTNSAGATGVSPAKSSRVTQIKTGLLSPLQEDESRYYATAVLAKTNDHLKLATVAWPKEPLESWLATAENQMLVAVVLPTASYKLPEITADGCIDDTWAATAGPPDARHSHTAVWTGSEMIIWGGKFPISSFSVRAGATIPPRTAGCLLVASTRLRREARHTAVWTGAEMIVVGRVRWHYRLEYGRSIQSGNG